MNIFYLELVSQTKNQILELDYKFDKDKTKIIKLDKKKTKKKSTKSRNRSKKNKTYNLLE